MLERRKARRIALELLYQEDITKFPLEEIINNYTELKEFALSPFSLKVARGARKHRKKIDSLIERYADHWSIGRMPFLDRNIIRLGVYEMLFENDIPFGVSINEAVELAKTYGTEDSSKFVNGVLGKIAQELEEKEKVKKAASKEK